MVSGQREMRINGLQSRLVKKIFGLYRLRMTVGDLRSDQFHHILGGYFKD